jgi:hypothetical protein
VLDCFKVFLQNISQIAAKLQKSFDNPKKNSNFATYLTKKI